jgi:hypothetical protein
LANKEKGFFLYLYHLKRLLIIFTLGLYLASATEARELLKMPLLIKHYQEHKAGKSEISFTEFILVHYINLEEHGAEDAHDHSLPFKAHDNCHTLSLLLGGWPAFSGYALKPTVQELEEKVFHECNTCCFSFSAPIWQPPKLV